MLSLWITRATGNTAPDARQNEEERGGGKAGGAVTDEVKPQVLVPQGLLRFLSVRRLLLKVRWIPER